MIKNFKLEFDALKDRKKKEVSTPQISQKLDVVRWTETFLDFLSRIVGARNVPLAYVVRDVDIIDYTVPFVLIDDTCYTKDSRSLEEELIKRASHNHPLFKADNASVYHMLEEATQTMVYYASIKPFQRKKDGRNAWSSIVKQYAGDDQWKRQLEKSEDYINSKVWKGNTNHPLADHVSKHRNSYVSMV